MSMEEHYEPYELKRLIKNLKLDQSELAGVAGVSQGQVSRLISGKFKKPGKAYKKICNYISEALSSGQHMTAWGDGVIMEAISEVWDGSPEHARSLAHVIRSLGALSRKA